MNNHLSHRVISQGFTLIELTIVILLVGIISTMVYVRWPATGLGVEFNVRQVLYDIRYAQALSLTSGQRYRWVEISSTSYQITDESGTAVLLPSGASTVTLANNVTFGSFSNLPNNLIAFDSQGVPYIDSAYPGTALSAIAAIPIVSGSVTRSVLITPQTGYGVLQ